MREPKVVVLTGMHRSGTSLVASLLRRTGVFLGYDLLGPGSGNPRGHFEDLSFLKFHQDLLRKSGQKIMLASQFADPVIGEEDIAYAQDLIRTRKPHHLWGWKDPRTSLFLDLWAGLLPRASFIFVFRDPIDVVLSLLRRGSDYEVLIDPLIGLLTWKIYNERILEFYLRAPERHFLCNTYAVSASPERFLSATREKLGLPLANEDVHDLVHPEELNRAPFDTDSYSLLRTRFSEVFTLSSDLQDRADFYENADRSILSMVAPPSQAEKERSCLLDPSQCSDSALFSHVLNNIDSPTHFERRQKLMDHLHSLSRSLEHRDQHIEQLRHYTSSMESLRNQLEDRIHDLSRRAAALELLSDARSRELAEMTARSLRLERSRENDRRRAQELQSDLETLHQALARLVVHKAKATN